MSGIGDDRAGTRPAALVTASCRGEGLDAPARALRRDLRPVDRPASAAHLGRRQAGRAGRRDRRHGPRLRGRLRAPARCSTARCGSSARRAAIRPTSTWPRPPRKGIPVLRTPGRNADGVAELTVALLFAVTRHLLPGDRDVRADQVFVDGSIPYQRYRAWQVAGPHRRPRRARRGRPGRHVALRGARHAGRSRSIPTRADATHDSLEAMLAEADVVSMHAAPTPETLGMMGAAQFAAMRRRRRLPELGPGRAARPRRAGRSRCQSGHLAGAGLDHFDGEHLPVGPPADSTMDNVVLTPHIGGATYDTEANHTDDDRRGRAPHPRRRTPTALRQPGGPAMTHPTVTRPAGEESTVVPLDEVQGGRAGRGQDACTPGVWSRARPATCRAGSTTARWW